MVTRQDLSTDTIALIVGALAALVALIEKIVALLHSLTGV